MAATFAALLASLSALAASLALAQSPNRALQRLGMISAQPAARLLSGAGLERLVASFGRTRVARVFAGRSGRRERRLQLAGLPDRVEAVIGLKLVGFVAAGGLVLALGLLAPAALGAAPIVGTAAWQGPDLFLARMAKRRQDRIAAQVPDLVELLAATTEAGLSPAQAFRRSAGILRGPLGDETRAVVAQVDLGVPWRGALDHLLGRTEAPPLRSLVRAMERSRRLGSPMSATLRTVAEDLRSEHRVRAEESARRAPVKMLFPLVLLILPAFLLLTVGPVVLATLRSLH